MADPEKQGPLSMCIPVSAPGGFRGSAERLLENPQSEIRNPK
jgi:hypothetical protein